MTDTFDPKHDKSEIGGDPSSRSGSMATTGDDATPTMTDDLHPDHDQPAEGGVEEAEDGDGDAPPGR